MHQSPHRSAATSQHPSGLSLDKVSWDDLRLFVMAARNGSFRRAAAILQIASSTVPRRMERLERDLGFRLFDRLPEGIRLTHQGHGVLATAQKMQEVSLELRRYLDQDLTTRGIVRCAVTEGLGTYWLMPKLAEFHRANPYTVVDLRCTMAFADVMRFESDLAIQIARPTRPDLKVAKLGRMHVCLFASRRYLDTFGAPRTKADLAQHRIIDQVSPQIPDGILAQLLELDSIEGVIALRTDASSTHFHAIEQGIGIGLLPTYAVPLGADVETLDLGVYRAVDIWLTYHPDIREVPRIALFIGWVRDLFDPGRYPWFRDDFVHPRDLAEWRPRRTGAGIDGPNSVMVHPRDVDERA